MNNKISINSTFIPSNPIAAHSETHLETYILPWKDSSGKERFYRVRMYGYLKDGAREQMSFTEEQWKKIIGENAAEPLKSVGESEPDFHPSAISRFTLKLSPNGIEVGYVKTGQSESKTIHLETETIKKVANQFYKHIARLNPPMLAIEQKELISNLNSPPTGIKNEGNDCFISAYLQAFVLDDPALQKSLLDPKNNNISEIRAFLDAYQKAEKEKKAAQGVHAIREALCRINRKEKYRSGQHDPTETFGFLNEIRTDYFQTETVKTYWNIPEGQTPTDLLQKFTSDKIEAEIEDQKVYTTAINNDFNGIVPVIYQEGKSLEELLLAALTLPHEQREVQGESIQGLSVKRAWEKTPPHLIAMISSISGTLENADKLPPFDVTGRVTIRNPFPDGPPLTYELTSFIQHQGASGSSGHYVAYVKRGDNYFKCDDDKISLPMDKNQFLEQAKTASQAKYILSSNTPGG